MKFIKFLILVFAICYLTNLAENKNQAGSETAIKIIQDDLDSLISQLSHKNFSNHIDLSRDQQKEFLNQGQKIDLRDEIINAFQDLNNDFQQYQEVLNGDSVPKNNSVPVEEIEKNLNKTMNKEEILKEISEYSNQINKTFSVLDKINDYDKKIKNNKKKLAVVQKVQSYLKNLSHLLNATKSKSSVKKQIYLSIKNLTLLYQDYFNTHRIINKALLRRFNIIKSQVEETEKVDHGIKKSLTLFKRIVNFLKVLKSDKKENQDKKNVKEVKGFDKEKIFSTYSDFLSKLNEIDIHNQQIKARLIKRVSDVSNSGSHLKYRQKLEILGKLISFSKVLINLNDRVLIVKKKILNNLKKYSFQDLSDLMELTKTKSNDVKKKFEKLENLKNTLKFVHSAFQNNSQNLKNLKGKIVENINNIDQKLTNIKNYRKYHDQLSKIFKNVAERTRNIQNETHKIFQEIKIKKLNSSKKLNNSNTTINQILTTNNSMKNRPDKVGKNKNLTKEMKIKAETNLIIYLLTKFYLKKGK